MKKMFTKLSGAAIIMALALTSLAVKAQTTSLTNVDATTVTASAGTTINADAKAEVKPEAKAKAETKTAVKTKAADADTTWKPQRRLWGYAFGDEYYDAHADAANRGAEGMYNGVPTYRNAFQFRRLYLGYDYEISKKFKAEVLLASEPNANTGTVLA